MSERPQPQTKAERRELQERQRAEKAARLAAEGKTPAPKTPKTPAPSAPGAASSAGPSDGTRSGASSQPIAIPAAPRQTKDQPPPREQQQSPSPKGADALLRSPGARHEGGGSPSSSSSSTHTGVKGERKTGAPAKGPNPVPVSIQMDDAKLRSKLEKEQVFIRTESQKLVPLFSHLQQYERETSLTADLKHLKKAIHPAIVKLGLKFQPTPGNEGEAIVGANARCVGVLQALKQVIMDYVPAQDKTISRHLDAYLKPQISYLLRFRPMSVSMGSGIRYLKKQINLLPNDMHADDAKRTLDEAITRFIKERISFADELISAAVSTKINNGDVILTYACSSVVQHTLVDAHKKGKRFRVIVVDSRPRLEGRVMLRRLVAEGVDCHYVLLHALAYVMKEVSKVLLGGHALFSNGTLLSRAGTATVAMTAHSFSVPVIVCCETYKFSERVQLDSFVFNELGDPDELVDVSLGGASAGDAADLRADGPLSDWRDIGPLKLLSLVYDVTPPEYITTVATEVGLVPCTSVPVVLREYL